jgi:hypothetical protein
MMTADLIEQYERESKNTKVDSFKQRCKGNCYFESSLLVAWKCEPQVSTTSNISKEGKLPENINLGWRIDWNPTDSDDFQSNTTFRDIGQVTASSSSHHPKW